jgi:hypothetical protein
MATTDPTRAEHRRFSIRLPRPLWIGVATTLMIVVVAALRFGLPVYRQRAAKNALRGQGAYIETEYRGPASLGNPPMKVDGRDEEWEKNSLRRLFYDVTLVSMENDDFGDSDLRLFQDFPALKRAELSYCRVTDTGLASLRGLMQLEALMLDNTSIGDVGLAHVCGLPRLSVLRIDETNVTDAGLAHLTRLKNLRSLCLGSPGITDAGLKHIAAIPTLERLEFNSTARMSITDAGLEHFSGMRNLRKLDVSGVWAITDAGIERLRKALPDVKVVTLGDNEPYETW